MKKQDLIIIGVIVLFSGIFSYFISSKFITPNNVVMKAENVTVIDPSFPLPDSTVFNDKAVNPTVKIKIAPGKNDKPFANESQ
ncbi:MAG: hypothetical protein M3Q36_03385 [bacterium]|nr:hypothetical protein [bacterium]